ncbi:uncharacterized protein [Rutidosis leptorrhynchoides]|uniref:uncharacterized protein n=1 Tax=Rutidosis leptorrhynchoides TaxID=125765 RepID=UPI003A99079A
MTWPRKQLEPMMKPLAYYEEPTLSPNFWPSSQPFSTTPAFPSKITSLLLRRLEAMNHSIVSVPSTETTPMPAVSRRHDEVARPEEYRQDMVNFSDDFFSDLDDYLPVSDTTNVYCNAIFESSKPVHADHSDNNIVPSCISGDASGGSEMEEDEVGGFDFKIVDEIGSVCNISPFELAREMAFDPIHDVEEEPLTISEAMRRMKYERKFSISISLRVPWYTRVFKEKMWTKRDQNAKNRSSNNR